MRLIDADKLYPDCRTIDGKLAISQSQLANAPTVPLPDFKDGYKQAIIDGKTNFQRPQGKWITNQEYIDKEFNGHYEGSCFNSPYNCGCCGYSTEDNRPKFCSNCGADMRGESAHGW